MIKQKIWAMLHFIAIVAVIIFNYYANTGHVHGQTVGDVSAQYYNYFTPAAYAFSIWGVIFLGLLGLGVYSLFVSFQTREKSSFVNKLLPYLLVSYGGIMAWLWFWLKGETLISVGIMSFILITLILTTLQLQRISNMIIGRRKLLIQSPIAIFFGWISVALIANVSAHLTAIDWNGWGISDENWTIIMIVLTVALSIMVLQKVRLREFVLIAIWALIAISFKHKDLVFEIYLSAIIASILLGIAVSVSYLKRKQES